MTLVAAKVLDATHLELVEPISNQHGQIVYLAFAAPDELDELREDWLNASQVSMSRAYGENEPEYPLSMIKEHNPEYRP